MIKIVFTIVISAFALIAHSQSSFGIQIDIGRSTLNRISDDTIVAYGYSGAKHSVKNIFYISPSLRFRKNLNSKISFESGLGYLSLNHQIRLKYNYDFFQTYVDTTLKIHLQYLNIPFAFNYSIPIASKSSLLLTATLNTNILISKKDNFEDILFEEIGWIKRNWYTKLIFAPSLSIAYQVKLKDSKISELGLYLSNDVNAFVKKEDGWGFYKNLNSSRNLRYGLQLKYFFNI